MGGKKRGVGGGGQKGTLFGRSFIFGPSEKRFGAVETANMSVSRGKRLAAAAYYGVVSIVVQFATKVGDGKGEGATGKDGRTDG